MKVLKLRLSKLEREDTGKFHIYLATQKRMKKEGKKEGKEEREGKEGTKEDQKGSYSF